MNAYNILKLFPCGVGSTAFVVFLHFLAAVCFLGAVSAAEGARPLKLVVSEKGDDQSKGPFATLKRARDEIRALKSKKQFPKGGVIVELEEGEYTVEEPLRLTSEDGGTEEAPVVYRAASKGKAKLRGGKVLLDWHPVTEGSLLSRLNESVRDRVVQTDLKAHGISEYGTSEGGGIELFFNGQPMTLARWPNEGFVHIVDVLSIEPVNVRGTKGDKGGKFIYEGDRPLRWKEEKDLWLHGYWFWDWSDQRMKVEAIDTDERIVTLSPPQHNYGYRKGQWYYAMNAFSEIDVPGEWYLDREEGILTFYPPSSLKEGEAVVSVAPNLIQVEGAAHVRIEGLFMEACRETAFVMRDAVSCRVVGCTIRNVGGQAVSISGGRDCSVEGCNLYQMAKGGVSLNGGDRHTLEPAGHFAENNHIHDFARWYRMYNGGIHVNGVGNRASHNLIHDAPHTAIFFGGNEHLIEFNEIHHVCEESNDAGAIYAGRNWTMRGTVIQNNYLHDIKGFQDRGCVGVYLDDMFCGTIIRNNLFYRVTNAAFIGGGRDNVVENNVFVQCNPSLHVDARAMGWAKYHTDGWVKEMKEKKTHLGLPFLESPYIDRYPALATLLRGDPYAPEGNLIARNVHWDGTWGGIEGKAKPMLQMKDNLLDEDPLFVRPEKLNFRLKKKSPAFDLGFEAIPLDKIGLAR